MPAIATAISDPPPFERPDLDDTRALVREAGIRYPVAITATAFAVAIHPLDGTKLPEGQDTHGRLWDVLMVLRHAIQQSDGGSEVRFTVDVFDGRQHQPVQLKAVCGPDDEGSYRDGQSDGVERGPAAGGRAGVAAA